MWERYWFTPQTGVSVAIARAAICGYMLWKLHDQAYDFAAWRRARTHLAKHWQKPWLLRALHVPMLGERGEQILRGLQIAGLACGAIGLASQLACAIAFVSTAYLLGMRHGLRMHHTTLAIKFWLFIFALTPATDVWSMDAWIAGRMGHHVVAAPEAYGWCLQMCRTVVAITIFATGLAKIRNMSMGAGGAGFCHRKNLSDLLRLHDYPFVFVKPLVSMSGLLAKSPLLEFVFSVGVLLAELGFPLVLFWPDAAWFFVPAILGMIIGFRLFIGARFDLLTVGVVVFFLPWERLL